MLDIDTPDVTVAARAVDALKSIAMGAHTPTVETETEMVTGTYTVTKADDARQLVFGWASVSVTKDGDEIVDAHGEAIPLDDLEDAAYDFVLTARKSAEGHEADEADADLVESIVFTPDKLEALGLAKDALPGGWFVGFHIPDRAAYDKAVQGGAAFSILGSAVVEDVE